MNICFWMLSTLSKVSLVAALLAKESCIMKKKWIKLVNKNNMKLHFFSDETLIFCEPSMGSSCGLVLEVHKHLVNHS